MRAALSLAAVVFALDQLTKAWLIETLPLPGQMLTVTSYFNLAHVLNRGVSFGLLHVKESWGPYLFAAIGLAISIGIFLWMRKAETRLAALALGCILGGALGNIADRITRGAVVDFLDFHYAGFHWWTFNVADVGISVGVAGLLAVSLFDRRGRTTKEGQGGSTGERAGG